MPRRASFFPRHFFLARCRSRCCRSPLLQQSDCRECFLHFAGRLDGCGSSVVDYERYYALIFRLYAIEVRLSVRQFRSFVLWRPNFLFVLATAADVAEIIASFDEGQEAHNLSTTREDQCCMRFSIWTLSSFIPIEWVTPCVFHSLLAWLSQLDEKLIKEVRKSLFMYDTRKILLDARVSARPSVGAVDLKYQ